MNVDQASLQSARRIIQGELDVVTEAERGLANIEHLRGSLNDRRAALQRDVAWIDAKLRDFH